MTTKNNPFVTTALILFSICAFIFIINYINQLYYQRQAVTYLNNFIEDITKQSKSKAFTKPFVNPNTSPFKYPKNYKTNINKIQKSKTLLNNKIKQSQKKDYEIIDLETPYIKWSN